MLTTILIGNILKYVIYVFGSFVFFSTGWLYLDSSKSRKGKQYYLVVRGFGFVLLAIANIYFATQLSYKLLDFVFKSLTTASLAIILFSYIPEGILSKPKNKIAFVLPSNLPLFTKSVVDPLNFVISLMIPILLLYKITKGFEKQLKWLFVGFTFYAVSNLINVFLNTSGVSSVFWLDILGPYRTIWFTHLFLYLIGVLLIGYWTLGYLRFRVGSLLFITTIASSLFIFSMTAILFNILLLKNIENNTLKNLETNVRLFKYSLENLQLDTLSTSESMALDGDIINSLAEKDRATLYSKFSKTIASKRIGSITIVDKEGTVVLRTLDKDSYGDKITSDNTINSALDDQKLSIVAKEEGVIYPILKIKSAVPIHDSVEIIGAILTEFNIDNSFVDGVKEVTGLDVNVFAGEVRSATTIISTDKKSRLLGTNETNDKIINTVINQQKIYSGSNSIANIPYYSSYLPLTSYQNGAVGMISVGKPQLFIVETVLENIRITFLGSALLIIISIIPSYFLAKYMERNLSS